MTGKTFHFSFSDLKLSVTQMERFMGYKEGESHEVITELIRRLLGEAEAISEIKAEYRIFPIVKFIEPEKSIQVEDCVFNVNKIVFGQLKRAESIAVFICTAGKEIGLLSRESMRSGDLLTGYVYDVIGSEAVEAAVDLMQENLKNTILAEGKNITNRYSPGYCKWDVAEQHKLFSLMPDNYCGVKLNESALMDPEKSVSGFIGIGERVRYNPYTCRICDMKDCIYRNLRGNN